MNKKPFPNLKLNKGLKSVIVSFVLTWNIAPLMAAQTHHLDVQIPASIIAGEEVTVKIQALSDENVLVSNDSRTLEVFIFNGAVSTTQEIKLIKGKGELKIKFENPGASLIQTADPLNPTLVNYQAFEVAYKAGELK